MKRITYLLLLVSTLGFTQYKGKIVDTEKHAIAFVNVVAYDSVNKLVDAVISDENGLFKINKKNNIYLEFSFVGFKTKKLIPTKNDLGIITLEESSEELMPVNIVARKKLIQQKVDRLVFNVSNSLASKGGTALDALKNTPTVNVSQKDLAIVGKGNVLVLVNDRLIKLSQEDLVSYLNSIPSDNIKKIEVITAPPAKYDAEGNSGVINIVLKKAKNNSWSNQIRSSYTQGYYGFTKIGNTFNYNKGKLVVSASIEGTKGNRYHSNDGFIDFPDASWNLINTTKIKKDNLSSRLGLDYVVNPSATLGFSYSNSFSNGDKHNKGTTTINDNKGSFQKLNGFDDTYNVNHNLNTHFIKKIGEKGQIFSIDVDYFTFADKSKNTFTSQQFSTNSYYFKAESNGVRSINNLSVKADMIYPTSFGNFSIGAKTTRTKTNNKMKFFNLSNGGSILDQNQSNVFDFTEDIYATYVDFSKSLGEKVQMKAGLRIENTNTEGYSKTLDQTDKKEYLNYFPTFYLSYTKNPTNVFNANYSRRLSRPSFNSLNPFRFYLNANSYTEGNPFLRPSYSDNIEFKYIHKNKYITTLFSNFNHNRSTQIPNIDTTANTLFFTRDNIMDFQVYGLTQVVLTNPTKWWNMMNVATFVYGDGSYTKKVNLDFYKGLFYILQHKSTFTLNTKKTVQLETSFGYKSKQAVMFIKQNESISSNIALNFSFLNKKLNCNLSVNDLFKKEVRTNQFNLTGVNQKFKNYHDNQKVKLSLTYSFGGNKIKTSKVRSGNREEKQRL